MGKRGETIRVQEARAAGRNVGINPSIGADTEMNQFTPKFLPDDVQEDVGRDELYKSTRDFVRAEDVVDTGMDPEQALLDKEERKKRGEDADQ